MLELTEIVTELNLADTMSLDEFLNNPEEDTVYGVPNDEFIQNLVELYRMPSDVHVDDSEVDYSIELPIVMLQTVWRLFVPFCNSKKILKIC
jgi:hypothetical protein